jgi:hypothetical protein
MLDTAAFSCRSRRLGIEAMPDFPPDFVYNGQPLDTPYFRYSLRCHVGREEDKAYYWPTMKAIWDLLEPRLKGWKDIYLRSDQAFERMIGKPGPDGGIRLSGSSAPVGGLQKLTRERLEMVCTRYLSDNTHLIDRFENEGRWHHRFFTPDHPKCVYFFLTEITASRVRTKRDRSMTYRYSPHDFWLQVGGYLHQWHFSRADKINQALDMYIWKDLWSAPECDALAKAIGALAGAFEIWRAESGYRGETYTRDDGSIAVRYSVEDEIEDAIDGRNRYGSRWIDLLNGSQIC